MDKTTFPTYLIRLEGEKMVPTMVPSFTKNRRTMIKRAKSLFILYPCEKIEIWRAYSFELVAILKK